MFSGLDETALLWISIGLLVILAGVWLAISVASSRETLKGGQLLLDRREDERDEDEDDRDCQVS